jgi:hypothetical protein
MKKTLFSLAIIFFSTINFCSAQVTFQKSIGGTFPDWGNSVRQTTDGGYIVAAGTMSGTTIDYRAYLIKTNINGDLLWTKAFKFWNEHAQDVQQTFDGGYILLTDFYPASQIATLIKTDASGDTLWTRYYLFPWEIVGYMRVGAYSIQQTADSGYIIAGLEGVNYFDSPFSQKANAFLMKINQSGDVVWAKSYGGSINEYGFSVQQTNDRGYIMAGTSTSFGADSADVYLVKTDAVGDTLWTRRYGGPRNEGGTSVKKTGDNGYIIVGTTKSFGAGGNDFYLVKTDSSGNLLWSKTYGGSGNDAASSVQITTDGGYIIVGNTNSFGANGIYLIKSDSLGNVEWSKAIGGQNPGSVQQTSDGGYVFTGQVFSDTGDLNVLLVKTDQLGNSGCNETDAATITNAVISKMSGTSTVIASKSVTNSIVPHSVDSVNTATTLCTTVGLNEIKSILPLLISPNPSSGDFVITFPGIINQGTVEIYTVLGERIISKAVSLTSNFEINLENSSPGIYFVKVTDGERRYAQKIMIEH